MTTCKSVVLLDVVNKPVSARHVRLSAKQDTHRYTHVNTEKQGSTLNTRTLACIIRLK